MSKINMIITGAPDGVGAKQLFENEDNLIDSWLTPNANKFPNSNFSGSKLQGCNTVTDTFTFDGGSAILSIVPDDFNNE